MAGVLAAILGAIIMLNGDLWYVPMGLLVLCTGYAVQISGKWNWYASMSILIVETLLFIRNTILYGGTDSQTVTVLVLNASIIYFLGCRAVKKYHMVGA